MTTTTTNTVAGESAAYQETLRVKIAARAGAFPARAICVHEDIAFVRDPVTEYAKPWRETCWRRVAAVAAAFVLLLALPQDATSFPIDGDQTVLPAGSELNEDAAYVPHEILRSEYRGDRTS